MGLDFKEVFEFLLENRFERSPGRYDLKGGIYYMVQSYETKHESEGFFEAHRKYIDLQYVVNGKERHDYAYLSALKIKEPYNPEKDVEFYDGSGSSLILDTQFFAIYFPEDAHKPNLRHKNEAEKMLKVVAKIPVKG
jgi:YhcH/YjgK/YiaL family protein